MSRHSIIIINYKVIHIRTLDIISKYIILVIVSSSKDNRILKSEIYSRVFIFSQFYDILFLWSHSGLPLARSFELDTRKKGFDSPWLHFRKSYSSRIGFFDYLKICHSSPEYSGEESLK